MVWADEADYAATATQMEHLAQQQAGFLGMETARQAGLGITVSYWESLAAIENWKQEAEHRAAQRLGRQQWYEAYQLRVCRVEREYGFSVSSSSD